MGDEAEVGHAAYEAPQRGRIQKLHPIFPGGLQGRATLEFSPKPYSTPPPIPAEPPPAATPLAESTAPQAAPSLSFVEA